MTVPTNTSSSRAPVIFVNALNRKEVVYIEDGKGRLILLERVTPPVLLQYHSSENSEIWEVKTSQGEKPPVASLIFYPHIQDLGILHCPPQVENVIYIVDSEVLIQFPHREDFVTPAYWRYLKDWRELPKEKNRKGKKKGKGKSGVSIRRSVSVLAGVTREPWASVGEGTVMITEIMWTPLDTGPAEKETKVSELSASIGELHDEK